MHDTNFVKNLKGVEYTGFITLHSPGFLFRLVSNLLPIIMGFEWRTVVSAYPVGNVVCMYNGILMTIIYLKYFVKKFVDRFQFISVLVGKICR